jgi:hypothetical protein
MTITIELSAAEEARLRAQALRERRDLETIIHALVRAGLEPTPAQVLLDTPVSEEAHARVVALLMKDGLLTTLPTRPGQTMPFQPIVLQGRPVSETLLEDREPLATG